MSDHESVQDYYGKVLSSSKDLQTSACCIGGSVPEYLKKSIKLVHDDVISKFYGCGSPIPLALEGKTVLDLGCGTGRDVYVLSHLVGEQGRVIGVDMTDEQLDVARKYQGYHTEKFGYRETNVDFRKGYIEDLKSMDIADNSIDAVVSNCVINLSPDKDAVFSELFRVLKPGGELYFSDVFSSQRVPQELRQDPVLLGECLSGAMYTEDFRRMLNKIGCADYRIIDRSPIEITQPEIDEKIGMINFFSLTVRAFKMDLEDRCENFGHVATYKGGIDFAKHAFMLDDHHLFRKGLPEPVCGNTAKMLMDSRFGKFFDVQGNFETHYGLFDCGPGDGVMMTPTTDNVGACC